MVTKRKEEPTMISKVQQYSKEVLLIDVMIKDLRNTIVNAAYLHFRVDYKQNLELMIADLEFKKLQLKQQIKAHLSIIVEASKKNFVFTNDHLSTKELVDGYVELLEVTEKAEQPESISHVLFLSGWVSPDRTILPGEIVPVKDVTDSVLNSLAPCLTESDRLFRALGKNSVIRVKLVED